MLWSQRPWLVSTSLRKEQRTTFMVLVFIVLMLLQSLPAWWDVEVLKVHETRSIIRLRHLYVLLLFRMHFVVCRIFAVVYFIIFGLINQLQLHVFLVIWVACLCDLFPTLIPFSWLNCFLLFSVNEFLWLSDPAKSNSAHKNLLRVLRWWISFRHQCNCGSFGIYWVAIRRC